MRSTTVRSKTVTIFLFVGIIFIFWAIVVSRKICSVLKTYLLIIHVNNTNPVRWYHILNLLSNFYQDGYHKKKIYRLKRCVLTTNIYWCYFLDYNRRYSCVLHAYYLRRILAILRDECALFWSLLWHWNINPSTKKKRNYFFF